MKPTKQAPDTRDYLNNPVTEKEMRETYVKAFGKEYDSADRKQLPLPIEIAYAVAINKLNDLTVLGEAIKMIGWQGGTIHQVKAHINALPVMEKGMFLSRLKLRIEHDNDLFRQFMAEYAPLRTSHLTISEI